MNATLIQDIRGEWEKAVAGLLQGDFFRRLQTGSLTLPHYKALLREIYFNTRENPQTFALMAAHLKGNKRDLSPRIFRHCLAEYGHHNMALGDLRNLGTNVTNIPLERPLPTTEALIAFAVYQVQHSNPVGYLGYIYHMEMLPAGRGGEFLKSLEAIGVPLEAMAFLEEHAKVDVTHTKWLEDYLRVAIETEDDYQAVIHVIRGSCRLHGLMFQGILDAVADGEAPASGPDWKAAGAPVTTGKPADKPLAA